ncbi:unnamed protein product, partial [Bubo scandiacus]
AHRCCRAPEQRGRSHLPILPCFQSHNYLCTPEQGKTSQIWVRKCPTLSPSSSPVPRALLLWQFYLGKLQLSVPFIWAALAYSSKINLLPSEVQQFPQAG